MIIVTVIAFVALVVVAAMRPSRADMSRFELERRASDMDAGAIELLRREMLLGDISTLLRILTTLLLIIVVLLSVATFGWFFGTLAAVVVALEYGAVARVKPFSGWAQRLYEKYEPQILDIVEKMDVVMRFLRGVSFDSQPAAKLHSREEIAHAIDESDAMLNKDEKTFIKNSLIFKDKLVSEVMTPRSVIDSIKKDELLGPLVLDSLHKTGHSRFPVVDGDIDHVVGILYVREIMALQKKDSSTAEKAMNSKVFYIREDQTLQHALMAFLKTRHHLFVVVNEFRETVGLLTLEDVIEALLGQKIVDEFDAYDDLRVVAARNPRANNKHAGGKDI